MSFKRKMFSGIREFLDDLKNNLLPSGAVVWFDRTTAPTGWVICNGQTYTDSAGNTKTAPNLIGRYPLGATSDIGANIAAGLPNITGQFSAGGFSASGAIKIASTGSSLAFHSGGNVWYSRRFSFNASNSNSVYGNSSTVTPPSVKLLPCVKK